MTRYGLMREGLMKLENTRGLDSPTHRAAQIGAVLLVFCLLIPLDALAFRWSLQPEEIEDAYSLGQMRLQEELRDFLKDYQHTIPYPSNKPFVFVQLVEFQTPYEQIVVRSQQTYGYSKFKAAEDYRANPRLVVVRVQVGLTNGYTGPEPSADSFQVIVSQRQRIEPTNVATTVPCDPYNLVMFGNCPAYLREIDLNFDAKQFTHGSATVKVLLPGDFSQETKFNLDELK